MHHRYLKNGAPLFGLAERTPSMFYPSFLKIGVLQLLIWQAFLGREGAPNKHCHSDFIIG